MASTITHPQSTAGSIIRPIGANLSADQFGAAFLIAAFLILRLTLAATVPLTIDESYAVVVSRAHSLSYFDHPPLGFELARLMADVTGSEARFIVRIPYVLIGSLSAWVLFDLSRLAYGRRAAFWAVAWYSVAPFFLISAGHFVVPDGPLDLFLLASARLVAPVFMDPDRAGAKGRWLASGLMLAFALMSKYQAGLFVVSALIVLVSTGGGRAALRGPEPWLAAAIASLGLLPVIVWNMHHGWASIAFQAGRAADDRGGFLHPGNFIVTILGQAAYLWPVSWWLGMVAVRRGLRRGAAEADRFFAIMAVIPIALFDIIALVSAHSLPHWSMSGFLFTFPAIGKWWAQRAQNGAVGPRRAFTLAASLVVTATICFVAQARTAVMTRFFFPSAPRFDVSWPIVDWSKLPAALASQKDGADEPFFVVAADWEQAAKIGAALGPQIPLEVLNGDPRHFQFMHDPRLARRDRGYFVAAARFDQELAVEAEYRTRLAHKFRVGTARWFVQDVAGFPDFDLLVMPVRRKVDGSPGPFPKQSFQAHVLQHH